MDLQSLRIGENDIENSLLRIKVVGLLTTIAFQKARLCALKLHHHLSFKFSKPEIIEMLQFDWHEYLHKLQLEIGGKTWVLKRPVAVFLDEEFIGSDIDFHRLISDSYLINLPSDLGYYESFIAENYRRFCEKMKRSFVYFTFSSDGQKIGSLLFMLYSDLLPKTCEYFTSLCNGKNLCDGTNLSYKGTNVHRIVKNGWIQSGGIDINDLKSAMDELIIPDESYCISHNKRGVLSLSNDGKNSNGPQFIISLKSNLWMDYCFVAFGELVDGIKTLKLIEEVPVCREKPLKNIKIDYCGEYFFREEPRIFKDADAFVDYKSQIDENETSEASICGFSKFPDISPWLYNIADKLDLRDVPSILMADKYFKGLYCLSTDYLPSMNLNLQNEKCSEKEILESKSISFCDVNNLLSHFESKSSDPELKEHIHKICRKIVTCALDCCAKRVCPEKIVPSKSEILKLVLEVAQEMINSVVEKSTRSESDFEKANSDLESFLESDGEEKDAMAEKSISLIKEVLNSATSFVVETLSGEEKEDT